MERIISAERVEDILNVFGSFDQNLHIIEKEWNVCVTDRDAELKISGEPEDVVSAEKAVQNLLMLGRARRERGRTARALCDRHDPLWTGGSDPRAGQRRCLHHGEGPPGSSRKRSARRRMCRPSARTP